MLRSVRIRFGCSEEEYPRCVVEQRTANSEQRTANSEQRTANSYENKAQGGELGVIEMWEISV